MQKREGGGLGDCETGKKLKCDYLFENIIFINDSTPQILYIPP